MQRPRDAEDAQQNGGAPQQVWAQDESIAAIQQQILDSAGDNVGGLEGDEVEDDDLFRALDDQGPSRALQTQESSSWYAVHSIAGRSSDGRDKQNQDAFLIVNELGGDPEVSLFGVFDGHGRNGHLVSYFAKSVLPSILARELPGIRDAAQEMATRGENVEGKATVSSGTIADIMSDACATLQRMLEEQDKFDCQSSGSTAIFSLVAYGFVYMANVGDSRALLAHVTDEAHTSVHDREKLVVVPMSVDQVPNVREERDRVEQSGGLVRRDEDSLTGEQGPFRVWRRDLAGPGLAMSRSLGDAAAHQIGVSELPVVMEYRLADTDRLLIIATDGVWDMLDNSEVVDISARASGDCQGDPAYAAAQVCQTARRAWEFKETRVDDITCMLIFLPPQRTPAPALAAQQTYPQYSHIQADANYSGEWGYTQPPEYTSISSDPRPAAAPSMSIATDAYAAYRNSDSVHGNSAYAASSSVYASRTTPASYIALSREAYGAQDRTIPYRPADASHQYQPMEGEEYGSSAYRPPQADSTGYTRAHAQAHARAHAQCMMHTRTCTRIEHVTSTTDYGYYRDGPATRERSAPGTNSTNS